MTLLALRLVLLALAVGAVLTGLTTSRHEAEALSTEAAAVPVTPSAIHQVDPARLLQLARRITPFRIGGRPPVARYGAAPVPSQPGAPPVPRPLLALTGMVLGREPAAILEGVPGEEGPVVVRLGDVRGPVKIVSVDSERVVVRGLDTTWSLQVRQPWH